MKNLLEGFVLAGIFFFVVWLLAIVTQNSFVTTAVLFLLGAVAMLTVMKEPRR